MFELTYYGNALIARRIKESGDMNGDEINKTFIQGESGPKRFYKGTLNFVDVTRRIYVLWTTEILIGREPSCDICLPDKRVSRKHAIVNVGVDGARFCDLQSSNGSARNGEKVEGVIILNNGDILEIGGAFKLGAKVREKDDVVESLLISAGVEEYLLTQSEMLIGRDPARVDVAADDPEMEPVHAQIEFIYDTPIITSLVEAKPVMVDGHPTRSAGLRPFSILLIGNTKFTWRF